MHYANMQWARLNPAGIGEHSDLTQTIEKELMEIAKYDDILDVLDKYFADDTKKLTLNE